MQLEIKPLSPTQQESLASWLNNPECDAFIEVLQARVLELQVKAANDFLEASLHDREPMLNNARQQILDAAHVARAINLIEKFRDGKEEFRSITAHPSNQPR